VFYREKYSVDYNTYVLSVVFVIIVHFTLLNTCGSGFRNIPCPGLFFIEDDRTVGVYKIATVSKFKPKSACPCQGS